MNAAEPKMVFVIEDDPAIRESLTEILIDSGYPVSAAIHGKEALDLLNSTENLPGLILLDIMMPIMDGYEFRKLQLSSPRLATIPTVAVSADGHLKEKSEKLSVTQFLKKPVDLEQLLELVTKYCGP